MVAFGDKFAPSATFMTISAFSILPSVVAWFLPNLLISNAKTGDAFRLTLLNLFTNIGVAGTTIWFGIEVMLTCMVIGAFLSLPVRLWIVNKHVQIDFKSLTKSLLPPSISALLMFFFLMMLKTHLEGQFQSDVLILLILVFLGALLYPLFLFGLFFRSAKLHTLELKAMFLKGEAKR